VIESTERDTAGNAWTAQWIEQWDALRHGKITPVIASALIACGSLSSTLAIAVVAVAVALFGPVEPAAVTAPIPTAMQTVSTPGDSPDNPLVLQPLPGSGGGAQADQSAAPAEAPTHTASTPQEARDVAAPQTAAQTAQTDSAAPSTGQVDPAVIAQLLQAAQGGTGSGGSGSGTDAGQLAGLLSNLDPTTLNSLLSAARSACTVLR